MKKIIIGVVAVLSFGSSVFSGDTVSQKITCNFTKKIDSKSGFTQKWSGVKEGGWITGVDGATRSGSELDKLLIYKGTKCPSKFIVSTAVMVKTADGAHFTGVAFNIQDEKNFYVFRINSGEKGGNGMYQVLKMVDGKWKGLKSSQFNAIKGGVIYTLIVLAKDSGEFIISIKKGDEVVLKPENVNDTTRSVYSGGNPGIYMGAAECKITNFSFEGMKSQASSNLIPLKAAVDKSNFGSKISRTMTALATSTPEKRNKVRLLFYGQSIIGLPWTHALARRLKAKYPNADFSYKNLSIGGFTSERLVKTAKQDLYPYYADFVIFHDYAPFKTTKREWEEMIATLRKLTTAEILVTTHHMSHQGNNWVQEKYDKQSQMIRDIAKKYDCELVDIRPQWKKHLKDNNLKTNDLLRDIVHLNKKGCKLMEEMVWRHLRYDPKFKNPHTKWIKRIPVSPEKNGSIKIKFNGNRIDIVAGAPVGKMGTAKILIDNKPPSANPKAYTVTRTSKTPHAWWPAIYTISSNTAMPQIEDWTLTVTDVPKSGPLKFKVSGSKTGLDGTGNSGEKFISKSGRVVIDPNDFGIKASVSMTKKKCPVGFAVKWSVVPMFKDTYIPPEKIDPAKENTTTVVQLIENGPHTLEIIPNGDGAVPIKEIVVYQPALK